MGELGLRLTRARQAQGVSLEEVERSTRIGKRYLQALEADDYSVFPAPVYARGFLRTYCRFLGIELEDQDLRPPAEPQGEVPPPPQPISRPFEFRLSWFIVAVTVVAFAGLAFTLLQRDTSLGDAVAIPPTADPADELPEATSIEAVPLDVMPNVQGANLGQARQALDERELDYVIAETASDAPPGVVVGQSPQGGTSVQPGDRVTLTVSSGGQATIRTDCDEIEGTPFGSPAEEEWYEENCSPDQLPERFDCEVMRGTPYESDDERVWFQANCITPTP